MAIESCSICGSGMAAWAVGQALLATGIEIRTIAGRDYERAARLAGEVGATARSVDEADVDVDLVLLCIPDMALTKVAGEIGGDRLFPNTIVAHMSGASAIAVLSPARKRGARVGKMHPIASLASGPERLKGIVWGIDGDKGVTAELGSIARRLGGMPMELHAVDLSLYHLAAIFASNFVLATLTAAADLWQTSGAPLPPGQALIPLAQTVLANWAAKGLDQSLTGPIARGEVEAVAAQIRSLAKWSPELLEVYRSLAGLNAQIVGRRGGAGAHAIAEIGRLLAENAVVD